MPGRSVSIERRNAFRSPYLNDEGVDGVTGLYSPAFLLIQQRNTVINRTDMGAFDDPNTFPVETLQRPATYGKTP